MQDSYGGQIGLKRLVNAAHQAGIAVVLDVVYNHLGAEGNYLGDYGPYFTDRHQTPWGAAVNLDGPGSDQVRRYFIENAVYFCCRDLHIDALRLDAIHAMMDSSAMPFLQELTARW
ncbi:MAG: alpha-amylase family glycosyl hydrolase [Microthrixaceae bacterium]